MTESFPILPLGTIPASRVAPDHLDDTLLRESVRSLAREMLMDGKPYPVLPSLLRTHRTVTPERCRCGYTGAWAEHVTVVLECAGVVSAGF